MGPEFHTFSIKNILKDPVYQELLINFRPIYAPIC